MHFCRILASRRACSEAPIWPIFQRGGIQDTFRGFQLWEGQFPWRLGVWKCPVASLHRACGGNTSSICQTYGKGQKSLIYTVWKILQAPPYAECKEVPGHFHTLRRHASRLSKDCYPDLLWFTKRYDTWRSDCWFINYSFFKFGVFSSSQRGQVTQYTLCCWNLPTKHLMQYN